MESTLQRIWEDLLSRPTGPMAFRLILQPLMATLLAIRAGKQDAKNGRPAYLWAVFTHPEERRALLKDGWKDIFRVFVLAVTMDAIAQVLMFKRLYPGESLLIGFLLAILPYVLIRGPISRLIKWQRKT